MKILFCDNDFGPFLNFRGYVADYLHSQGHEISLIVPASTISDKELAKSPSYLAVYPLDLEKTGSNPLSDFKYYKQLRRKIKELRPDIAFLYTIKPNIYGSIVSKSLGVPAVAMVAGLGYAFSGNSLKHILGRLLYKYGLRRARKVIVLNQSNYQTLLSYGFAKKENLIWFEGGEGVDLSKFAYKPDPYKRVKFLMVARVLYDKGYTEYVEAAKQIKEMYPDVEIELLGPIDEANPMGVPAEVLKSDVAKGYIDYLGVTDNVPAYVGQSGVVVVVVSSYHEGFNRSLMEACAMGKICITSNIPGCKEIVEDGVNGYLVEPKNPIELAAAMDKLINASEVERQRMAHNSIEKAREIFDIRKIVDKYNAIIQDLTGINPMKNS